MPRKTKTKTYSIEVTGNVDITATFNVKASSEDEAIAQAEQQFEDALVCTNDEAESGSIDWSCSSLDSTVTEEE